MSEDAPSTPVDDHATTGVATDGGEPVVMERDEDDDGDSFLSFLRELPVLLLIAFGLAFLLRMFVVQVFYIPSGSMIPTLEINDRIVVEKLTYLAREPARGEIIVFAGDEPTARESTNVQRIVRGTGQFLGIVPMDARDFVKRVIGVPGDTVSFDNGTVSVNGVELDEPYARLDSYDGPDEVVPAGKLFVMGDNRGSSSDSRYSSLGLVDADDVVGRAVLVLWPFDHFGSPEGADLSAVPDREVGDTSPTDDDPADDTSTDDATPTDESTPTSAGVLVGAR